MSLDLSKLTDAVTKVVALAASHADVSSQVATVAAERDAAFAAVTQAQADVDALTAKLLAAAGSPAEAAGLAAVSEALFVAPAPVDAPVLPAVAAVTALGTFLPGDPRANA